MSAGPQPGDAEVPEADAIEQHQPVTPTQPVPEHPVPHPGGEPRPTEASAADVSEQRREALPREDEARDDEVVPGDD